MTGNTYFAKFENALRPCGRFSSLDGYRPQTKLHERIHPAAADRRWADRLSRNHSTAYDAAWPFLCSLRTALGNWPTTRLKARLNDASES